MINSLISGTRKLSPFRIMSKSKSCPYNSLGSTYRSAQPCVAQMPMPDDIKYYEKLLSNKDLDVVACVC